MFSKLIRYGWVWSEELWRSRRWIRSYENRTYIFYYSFKITPSFLYKGMFRSAGTLQIADVILRVVFFLYLLFLCSSPAISSSRNVWLFRHFISLYQNNLLSCCPFFWHYAVPLTSFSKHPNLVKASLLWRNSRGIWARHQRLIYLFHVICHTIITKNKGKERKKEVARRPNRNYRSLWEIRPPRTMS